MTPSGESSRIIDTEHPPQKTKNPDTLEFALFTCAIKDGENPYVDRARRLSRPWRPEPCSGPRRRPARRGGAKAHWATSPRPTAAFRPPPPPERPRPSPCAPRPPRP